MNKNKTEHQKIDMIRVVEILKSKYFSFCVAKKVIICLLTGVKENI